MNFQVEKIINLPVESNCYVIYKKNKSGCVIIDPGSKDSLELFDFLRSNSLNPEIVFLTHEHFDHIWGILKLAEYFKFEIYLSENCSISISNSKKNLSIFFDNIGFEIHTPFLNILKDKDVIPWDEFEFHMWETHGHSNSGICLWIKDMLFTGDTIIPKVKTVLKLPTSDRNQLLVSLNRIISRVKYPFIIYPGHLESQKIINQEEFNNLNLI